LGAQTYLANTHQGHGKKNQMGNWGRKTKPTQGASVNTPRHCSEMFLYFLRLLAARQAMDFSQVNPVAGHLCKSEILSNPRIHHQHFHPCAQNV